jgi:TRAP-type C4-dicarboxylate transport system permease small subunit
MAVMAFLKKVRGFSRGFSYIGNAAIAAMMLLTTADVIGRYFFNAPVLGAYEITEYLMLIMVFSFLAVAQSQKAHISVDIVYDRFPSPLRRFLARFNHFLCLVMSIFVSYMGVHRVLDILRSGASSTLLKIPDYPFAIFMVVGSVVLSIEFLLDVLNVDGAVEGKRAG